MIVSLSVVTGSKIACKTCDQLQGTFYIVLPNCLFFWKKWSRRVACIKNNKLRTTTQLLI